MMNINTRLKPKLVAIADSIRNKLPSSDLMTLDQMPTNILDIVTHDIEDAIIEKTIAGIYTNNRITVIGSYSLYGENNLTGVIMHNVISVGSNAFLTYNPNLIEFFEFPKVQRINALAFRGCNSCTLFNMYSPDRETIPTLLDSNAFAVTPIASGSGWIVINDALVNELKQAQNWANYADRIIGNTEAAELELL